MFSLREIQQPPANYLVQILNELRSGGFINSRRGKQGGYLLAKAPTDVTLFDIVTCIDGELLGLSSGSAGFSGKKVDGVWQEVVESLSEKTKSFTLESFLPDESEGMYYI